MPDVAPHSDLRAYATTGCPEAFERLVNAYGGMVYAICRRQLGNPTQAEDATQETFLKLARNAGKVRRNVAAWLHACAVSTSRDLARREATRQRHHREAAHMRHDHATPAEVLGQLDDALADLDEADRTLICERFFAGRNQAELADTLGISQSLVSRRLRQALERLRARLETLGVMAGTATLLTTLRAEAAVPLPATLHPLLMKLGLAVPTTSAASATALTTGVLLMSAKAKLATVAVVVLLLGGGIGWYVTHDRTPTPAAPTPIPFAQQYRLALGQNLKRIEPPFSEERDERERAVWQTWADEVHETQPDVIMEPPTGEQLRDRSVLSVEHADGKLERLGAFVIGRDEPDRRAWATERAALFGLKWYAMEDYFIPNRTHQTAWLSPPAMPWVLGDWVVRENATTEQRLDDYADLLAEQLGEPVQFQRRTIARPCIVWSGPTAEHPTPTGSPWPSTDVAWTITPTPPSVTNDGHVSLATGQLTLTPGDDFTTWGIALDMPVILDGGQLPPNIMLISDAVVEPDDPHRSEVLEQTFTQLEAQTGGDWRIESRTLDVWTPIVGDRAIFEAEHRLTEGQNLRFIPPPFDETRNRIEVADWNDPTRWAGGLDPIPLTSGVADDAAIRVQLENGAIGSRGLYRDFDAGFPEREWHRRMLFNLFELRWYEIADVPGMEPLFGDWVIRAVSTPEERLADYGKVLTEQLGRPAKFVKQPVTRQCVVWSLVDGSRTDDGAVNALYYTSATVPTNPQALPDFLRDEGMDFAAADPQNWPSMVGLPLIIEKDGVPLPRMDERIPRVVHVIFPEVELPPGDPRIAERLPAILANLEKQTGDRWTLEERTLDVWVPIVGAAR